MKKCPPVPEDVMGTCAEMCPAEGCPAGQMCCSNGCGHVCKSGTLLLFDFFFFTNGLYS